MYAIHKNSIKLRIEHFITDSNVDYRVLFLLLIKERFDTMRKRILAIVLMVVMIATTVLFTVGCTEATQVSHNVSQEADNFNVIRRLTVINTRTDKPSFELVAAFSLQVDNDDNQIEVVCETGKGEYKKHIIGLNDETMYVVEDISGAEVDKYRYEINFLPKQILPITFKSKD